MNNLSLTIVTMLHYNVCVRDTLEYTIKRPTYSMEAYNHKKEAIKAEFERDTPLKKFLDGNPEPAPKIMELVNNLYDTVYGEDSTIVRVAGNELRVDEAQHIAIYEATLPLHEEIFRIIDAHVNFANQNKQLEQEITQLVAADERFYRAIAYNCLLSDLERLFLEYNKARSEAKGAITPQSNFIQGDLTKISQLFTNVRAAQRAVQEDVWEVSDEIARLFDMTGGRRVLPQGKNFQNLFQDAKKHAQELVNKCEAEWRKLYQPAIQELIEKSKGNQGGQA